MTYRLPTAKTIFAALAKMSKRERAQPKRAAKRISHMEQQRRAREGQRRRKERLQREAMVKVAARLKDERAPRAPRGRGHAIGVGIMAVMEPGKWYGARDIGELAGVDKTSRYAVLGALMSKGLVERVQNPAWAPRGQPGGVGNPQQMMANPDVEPMWLYRLTEAGAAKRAGTTKEGNSKAAPARSPRAAVDG